MKECKDLCDVKSCFLCKLCLPDWLPAVEAQKRNFKVRKGEQIFKEGEPVEGIYFVYEGIFKVHKRWDSEKELIIRFAGAGDIIGHLGLGKDSLYPVSATALEHSVVCYLNMGFFESTLKVNTNLTYKLMRFFANELQESQKSMRDLAHMSVKARIAQAFLALKNQFGTNSEGFVNIGITRQDISSFAGSSYETLFKVINEFVMHNLVEFKGKNIRILNELMLQTIIEQDNT